MSSEAAAYLLSSLPKGAEIDRSAPMPLSVAPAADEAAHTPISAIDIGKGGKSDEDLLQELASASKEALSILFQRHARSVFNVGRRILRDDSEAEDLVQELFLFVFQRAGLFDPAKATGASWIIQMAYHRAIDRRRYLNARGHYSGQGIEEDRQPATRGQISIDEVAGKALLMKLRQELSPEQRQTLELHFFEGYTFHEIAEKTGQTFGNVRHHYYRAIERLRSYVFPGKRT